MNPVARLGSHLNTVVVGMVPARSTRMLQALGDLRVPSLPPRRRLSATVTPRRRLLLGIPPPLRSSTPVVGLLRALSSARPRRLSRQRRLCFVLGAQQAPATARLRRAILLRLRLPPVTTPRHRPRSSSHRPRRRTRRRVRATAQRPLRSRPRRHHTRRRRPTGRPRRQMLTRRQAPPSSALPGSKCLQPALGIHQRLLASLPERRVAPREVVVINTRLPPPRMTEFTL